MGLIKGDTRSLDKLISVFSGGGGGGYLLEECDGGSLCRAFWRLCGCSMEGY